MTIRKKASSFSHPRTLNPSQMGEAELIAEIDGYASLLNHTLADHALAKDMLPVKLGGYDLIDKVKSGIVLAALLDSITQYKGTVQQKQLNKQFCNMSPIDQNQSEYTNNIKSHCLSGTISFDQSLFSK